MDNFTYGKRAANLHESDPYWDSDDKVWRKRKDDSFDDEANDDRPDDEKYSNYPLIVIAMMVVLLLLALGLNYIMSHIGWEPITQSSIINLYMELKTQQHDNKLVIRNLSVNSNGKLYQRSTARPGYMNQVISYILLMMAISALIGALKSHNIGTTYVMLNITAYSCVVAIMLESKANQVRGLMVIILMTAFNVLVILLAVFKIF